MYSKIFSKTKLFRELIVYVEEPLRIEVSNSSLQFRSLTKYLGRDPKKGLFILIQFSTM